MLQCIISALKAEAEPLADYYGLKQDHSYDYPFYGTDEMKIICTGVGRKNINDVIKRQLHPPQFLKAPL